MLNPEGKDPWIGIWTDPRACLGVKMSEKKSSAPPTKKRSPNSEMADGIPISLRHTPQYACREVKLKCDGTLCRTGGEVKRKLAVGVGSQYSSLFLGTWCIEHYYR